MVETNVNVAHVTREVLEQIKRSIEKSITDWDTEEKRRYEISRTEFAPIYKACEQATKDFQVWTEDVDTFLNEKVEVKEMKTVLWWFHREVTVEVTRLTVFLDKHDSRWGIGDENVFLEYLPNLPVSCLEYKELKNNFKPEYSSYDAKNLYNGNIHMRSYRGLAVETKDMVRPEHPFRYVYSIKKSTKLRTLEIVTNLLQTNAVKYTISPELAKEA